MVGRYDIGRPGRAGRRERARERALHRAGRGVRGHAIRRQLYIYLFLVGTGAYFVAASGLEEAYLTSEGTAFIMIGAVGLIMSMTTTDIGQSLMLAVREEGRKTRAQNKKLTRGLVKAVREEGRKTRAAISDLADVVREEGRQTRAAIEDLGRQMQESNSRMDERLDRMSAAIETVSNDIKATSAAIKAASDDNRELFRQMLEAQNRILEKMA